MTLEDDLPESELLRHLADAVETRGFQVAHHFVAGHIRTAADRIEQLETDLRSAEAERDDALQDLHHYKKYLASAKAQAEQLEAAIETAYELMGQDPTHEMRDHANTIVSYAKEWRAELDECDDRIEQLEAELDAHRRELARVQYWCSTIGENARAIACDAEAALKPYYISEDTGPPAIQVDPTATIGYASGHGPDDPPIPIGGKS